MDILPGSHCSVRGWGGERRRGEVTLCRASNRCQIRTRGAMGREARADTGVETTAAQRLRSTTLFAVIVAYGGFGTFVYTHPTLRRVGSSREVSAGPVMIPPKRPRRRPWHAHRRPRHRLGHQRRAHPPCRAPRPRRCPSAPPRGSTCYRWASCPRSPACPQYRAPRRRDTRKRPR